MSQGSKVTPPQSMPSRWVKCISTQGNVRGVAIQATELVRETVARHKLKGKPAQGLGEAIMGALLISSYCKEGERVNLNIQSQGIFRQALVDAKPDGTVRGYLLEREASLVQEDPSLGPWSTGTLSVLRTRDREREMPYIGTVPLLTGHLAKDLTFYWAQSEQIPSAVGLAVNLQGDEVIAAGGFLVQILPGASPEEVKTIEQHVNEIQSLAERMAEYGNPATLLSQIFQSTAFMLLEEKPLAFQCGCSFERAYRALALIGSQEIGMILTEEDHATVHCDFCATEYTVGRADLERLIREASQSSEDSAEEGSGPSGRA